MRGGISVDLSWSNGKAASAVFSVDQDIVERPVRVVYGGREVASFTTSGGTVHTITNL